MRFTLEDVRMVAATTPRERTNWQPQTPQNEHGSDVCSYVTPQGTAGCLVGWIGDKLGLSPAIMEDSGGSVSTNFYLLERIDGAAREYLQSAQNQADDGSEWGHSIDCAEDTLLPFNERRHDGSL